MSEAEEEDAIGGTCECEEEIEILVESEETSRENGIGSSLPRGGCSLTRTDMDNSYLPPLSDDIALLILARLPSSKYCDLRLVNRRFRSLIKSGELNEIRKKIGFKEPKVFLLLNEAQYCCYEPYTRSCRNLPVCPVCPVCPHNKTTAYVVSKSFCMGTHLFMMGIIVKRKISLNFSDPRNFSDPDICRYELELNRWFKGPMMITPRFFFAYADCGSVACVAGGKEEFSVEVLNSAEKYNPESKSWELLPSMNRRRYFCSGFYIDSKFYVIGGQNENYDLLTCGECYDFERNVWKLIPNMIEDNTSTTFNAYQPTYFMAVVNNELYCLEFPSRHLKVYLKNNNTWKKAGSVPANIELCEGSEVALKSLGNELLLIGRTQCCRSTQEIVLCFCTPSPELDDVEWHVLNFYRQGWNLSIYNCCVMMV